MNPEPSKIKRAKIAIQNAKRRGQQRHINSTNKDTSIRPKKSSRYDRSDKGVTHISLNKITTDQRGYANAQMSASSTDVSIKHRCSNQKSPSTNLDAFRKKHLLPQAGKKHLKQTANPPKAVIFRIFAFLSKCTLLFTFIITHAPIVGNSDLFSSKNATLCR